MLRQVPRPGSQAIKSSAALQLQIALSPAWHPAQRHSLSAQLDNEVKPMFCAISSTVLLSRQQAGSRLGCSTCIVHD